MDTITVEKAQLVETLTQNREEHREIFLKAQERYREKWIEELERRLLEARNGEHIDRAIRLPEPEDHTADFDTALEMLEWEVGDTIELDRRDFQRFVQNRWEWDQVFAANTRSYLAE